MDWMELDGSGLPQKTKPVNAGRKKKDLWCLMQRYEGLGAPTAVATEGKETRDRMMHHAVEWANGHLGHLGSRCTEPWIIVASFFLSLVCHDPAR